jgi:hypothetical protein
MRFGTRSLFVLMTGIAVFVGIAVNFPPLLVPMASLLLAVLLAACVMSLTILIFFVVDKVRDLVGRSRD